MERTRFNKLRGDYEEAVQEAQDNDEFINDEKFLYGELNEGYTKLELTYFVTQLDNYEDDYKLALIEMLSE